MVGLLSLRGAPMTLVGSIWQLFILADHDLIYIHLFPTCVVVLHSVHHWCRTPRRTFNSWHLASAGSQAFFDMQNSCKSKQYIRFLNDRLVGWVCRGDMSGAAEAEPAVPDCARLPAPQLQPLPA